MHTTRNHHCGEGVEQVTALGRNPLLHPWGLGGGLIYSYGLRMADMGPQIEIRLLSQVE